MKCDTAMQRFLELDNREMLSLALHIHLLRCKRCKKEISLMEVSLGHMLDVPPYLLPRDMSNRIAEEIAKGNISYAKEISYFKWIAVGIIILMGRFAVTYSDTFVWLQNFFGGRFDIPLNIVLGLALTIYIILFVGFHMDDMRRVRRFYFK